MKTKLNVAKPHGRIRIQLTDLFRSVHMMGGGGGFGKQSKVTLSSVTKLGPRSK